MVKKSVLLVVLAGWLLPAWLGFAALFGWFDLAVAPRLGGHTPLNSFPFLAFAKTMLWIAGGWLSLLVITMSAFFVAGKRRPGKAPERAPDREE